MIADMVSRVTRKIGTLIINMGPVGEIRREKFNEMTGPFWQSAPNRFCREIQKIHPKLMGRFYGENHTRKAALEIFRSHGKVAFGYSWRIKQRNQWGKVMEVVGGSGFAPLVINGDCMGGSDNIRFYMGKGGRYYLSHEGGGEILMHRI